MVGGETNNNDDQKEKEWLSGRKKTRKCGKRIKKKITEVKILRNK